MQSLSATLLAAQKSNKKIELYRLVLSNNGTSYTYYAHSGSNRIKELELILEDDRHAALVILDNSDKTVSALSLEHYQAVISLGMTTSAGDEYSAKPPLHVIGQQDHSWPGKGDETGLPLSLSLAGIPNLMAEDQASEAYTQESDDTNTVKDLINKIAGDTSETMLTCYNHCEAYEVEFDSEDDLIDSFIPADAFSIQKRATRWGRIKWLLSNTDCVIRAEADGKLHVSVPVTTTSTAWVANTAYALGDTVIPTTPNEVEYKCTTAGTSHASTEPTWPTEVGETVTDGGTLVWTVSYDYDYRLESTYHTFFSETYRKRVVIPGYVEVESSIASGDSYTGKAEDSNYTNYPDPLKIRDHRSLRVTSDAQCVNIATAILSHHQAAAERGSGIVPINVGAEVHDFVKVKDTRLGQYRVGNIGFLRWRYKAGTQNTMEFRFGKLGAGLAGAIAAAGAGGGGGGVFDPGDIWNMLRWLEAMINEIVAWIEGYECYLAPYIKIHYVNGVPTSFTVLTTGITSLNLLNTSSSDLDIISSGAGTNLGISATSPTGGVSVKAGGLASAPDDKTLLLDAGEAVKVKSTTKFIIPVKS